MEDIAKGVTKGFFEHWEEKIPELVSKLKNKEIGFVQNKEAFEVVKREGDHPELRLFKQFAPKGWPRILFKIGLAMRDIETQQDAIQSLKDDVHRKFGKGGVHFAELVQRGIITELVGQLAKILGNSTDVTKKLSAFIDQVEDLAIFVSKADVKYVEQICERVKRRVDSMSSHMVIVFGSGYARSAVLKILACIKKEPEEYAIEMKDEWPQLVLFAYSAEMKGKLKHWTEPLAA